MWSVSESDDCGIIEMMLKKQRSLWIYMYVFYHQTTVLTVHEGCSHLDTHKFDPYPFRYFVPCYGLPKPNYSCSLKVKVGNDQENTQSKSNSCHKAWWKKT